MMPECSRNKHFQGKTNYLLIMMYESLHTSMEQQPDKWNAAPIMNDAYCYNTNRHLNTIHIHTP
jgi:hypothetical protein